LSSRQTSKLEEEEEGSHCQANLVAPVLGSVHIPLCRRQSEILEISPDILDFLETLEKSSENSRFTDNIVLSDDFQDSPIHPPPLGDIKILSIGIRAWCSDSSLSTWSLKMSTTCEVSFEPLRFYGSNYSCWSAHVLHVLHSWDPSFERVVVASILPEDFNSEDSSNLSKEERYCVLHNSSITNLIYNNVSKVIQEFIFNNEDIFVDAHHIWVALKDMYTSGDDEDGKEEEQSLEECSTSASCIHPLVSSTMQQIGTNVNATATDQPNSMAVGLETGGTRLDNEQSCNTSSSINATPHQPNEVYTNPSTSFQCTNNVKSQVTKGKRKKGSEVEQFDSELNKMTKKDKKNVLELIKRVRRKEDELTRQQAYRDSFEKESKQLKESSAFLTSKCKEDITKAYACHTNSLSCAASLEKEKKALRDQLEEITCMFVKLQIT
jgi:hypothetical protein